MRTSCEWKRFCSTPRQASSSGMKMRSKPDSWSSSSAAEGLGVRRM